MSATTVSLFCGAGGESLGKAAALAELGVSCSTLAVNHWDVAIATHQANLPDVRVLQEDICAVTAADLGIAHVDLLWASPSCVHHSRARGGKPRDDQQRAHAWEVLERWLRVADCPVVLIENVVEFRDWGPLDEAGRPILSRKSEYFDEWVFELRAMGYEVDWRVLCAADYGDPTTRRRMFLQAVRDGHGFGWPEPTHRDPRRPASLLDFNLPPWRTAAECIDWSIPCPSIFGRKKPLAEATLRRIAHGVMRHVVGAARPFIVTGSNRGEWEIVSPTLIQTGYGERDGQAPRSLDLHRPIGTIVAGGSKHGLVAAFLARHYGGARPVVSAPLDLPAPTVTAVDHHSLVAASLVTMRGTAEDQIRATGGTVEVPLGTVSAGGGHHGLVAAFLQHYYGTGGASSPAEPLDTVTTVSRHGLVTVEIDGETYAIADIGMRMLEPHELAAAMGFPAHFKFVRPDGRAASKADAVRMIGNAVPVGTAKALVSAVIGRRSRSFGAAA